MIVLNLLWPFIIAAVPRNPALTAWPQTTSTNTTYYIYERIIDNKTSSESSYPFAYPLYMNLSSKPPQSRKKPSPSDIIIACGHKVNNIVACGYQLLPVDVQG